MKKRFAVGTLVVTGCILAFIIAANAFPDATWSVVNEVRELRDLSPGLFRREEPPHSPSVWGFGVVPYGDPVVARLAKAERFAFGGVGVAGQTSEGELDYRLMLSRPNALPLFEELYREGNLQGKSYALVGIRELKPDLFKELSAPLNASSEQVVTQYGCVVTGEPLRDIVKRIEKEQVIVKFARPPRVHLASNVRRHVDAFDSEGVGLTETLLRFAQQEHIPIAIEFVNRDSMTRPITISLRQSSLADGLNVILRTGRGYRWEQRNGIVRVWNARSPEGRTNLLDTVIPEFKVSPQTTPQQASNGLWMALEVTLNPKILGFAGDFPSCDQSQIVRQSILHGKTVREILSHIVATSGADGWIIRVPPEHMGVVPQGGLWTVLQSRSPSCAYPFILQTMRPNF